MTTRANWICALATLAAAAWGFTGCAHGPAPAEQVESVGTLTAGASVWHAPVHETSAAPTVELAGSSDDDGTEVATTTVRTADAGEPDAAPSIEEKNSHGF